MNADGRQRLGGAEKIDPDKAIEDAAALAKASDVVIFVGGLTPEWESEGFDRPTLSMPGRQDETIARLAEASPKTVVCIQAVSLLFYVAAGLIVNITAGIRRLYALD